MVFNNPSGNGFVSHPFDFSEIPFSTDVASFRPDSEAVRSLKFNPSGGDASTLEYDFKDGKDDGKISDVMLTVRSGKLDKAEIQTLTDSLKDSSEKASKDSLDALRSEKVDKVLGIDSSSKS